MADETSPTIRTVEVTYVQVVDEPRPEVASLTPFALAGEPATDKGFITPSGARIRVRVVKGHETPAVAPTNGDVPLAPSSVTLYVSLAALDADDNVMADANGKLLITDKHEVPISDIMLQSGLAPVQESVERVIRQEAYAFEKRMAGRDELATYLNTEWGGAEPPVPPDEPVYLPLLEGPSS